MSESTFLGCLVVAAVVIGLLLGLIERAYA